MNKFIIIFIFVILTKPIYSQTFHVGATIGYGRGYIDYQAWFKEFFENNEGNKLSLSFYADYKPIKPIFNINTNLTIQTYFWNNATLNFLKIPLGADFVIGKKYQLIFGVNLYGQLLLFRTGNFHNYKFTSFQFGVTPDLGFCFSIYDKYSIFFRLNKDFMLTPLCTVDTHSPGGIPYSYTMKLYDLSINLGLKIKLNKNNNGL